MTQTSMIRHVPIALATILGILLALLLARPAIAAETLLGAELTGEAEVDAEGNPDQGDLDGSGSAVIAVDPALGQVCWSIEVAGITLPADAAHIHLGAAGVNGDVVVPLSAPDAEGIAEDCADGLDATLLQAIVDNPGGYYVNVHTSDFPAGALRGQLAVIEGGGCELAVSTEAAPDPVTDITVETGVEVRAEGFFVGDAEVFIILEMDGEVVLEETETADAEGFVEFGLVFEPGDEGTYTLTVGVEGTECGSQVEITVVEGAVATPAPTVPATGTPAPMLPNTAAASADPAPATPLAWLLVVLFGSTIVLGWRRARS